MLPKAAEEQPTTNAAEEQVAAEKQPTDPSAAEGKTNTTKIQAWFRGNKARKADEDTNQSFVQLIKNTAEIFRKNTQDTVNDFVEQSKEWKFFPP